MNTLESLAPLRYVTPETLERDLRTGHLNLHPAIAEGLRGTIGNDIDFLVAESLAGEPRGQVGINWKAPVLAVTRAALGLRPGEYVPNIAFAEVAEGHRGRGIGSLMFRAVMARIVERGHERAFLTVEVNNTGAKRLYERLDFEDLRHTISVPQFEQNADGTYGDPVVRDQDIFVRTFQPGEFSPSS